MDRTHVLDMDLGAAERRCAASDHAFTVASGLLAGCEAIVTNDEEWRRKLAPLFSQFRWLYLAEYL